jgi:hypothetical protein
VKYRVVPISSAVAASVRQTMKSPFGDLPAWPSVANGYGPCRSCLKTFRQGEEERIYITYNPFNGISDLPLPGPVFIHAEECEEYAQNEFPADLLEIPMIFEGYGQHSRLVASEPVDTNRLDEQISEMLVLPDVDLIHVRNGEAGCFITKIRQL